MRNGDFLFWSIWMSLIAGGVLVLITAMVRRLKVIEMAHRERMAMIERGLVPPADTALPDMLTQRRASDRASRRRRLLSGGIVVIALGLGLMTLLAITAGEPDIAVGVGGAIVILGAAFVALAFVQGIGEPPPSLPGSGSGLGL